MELRKVSPQLIRAAIIAGVVLLLIILAAVLLIPRPGAAPEVSQTSPQNEQEEVIPTRSVLITFSRDLSSEEQEGITFSTQPVTTLSPSWISADTLQLTPLENLSTASIYAVSVLYRGREIYSFTFRTLDITQEQFDEDLEQLAEGDELYYLAEAQWYTDNPWYAQLPIKGENFEILFEPNNNRFRIHIQVTSRASNYEIQRVKDVALLTLKNTGVDLNKYTVAYYLDYQD